MIEAAQLSFAYGRDARALEAMDFRIPAGTLAVLAGANGSGKSTLLSLLAGLETPSSGSLRLGGVLLPGQEAEARVLGRLVVQDADLHILGATLAEDLLLGREGEDPAAARGMAQRFGLLEHWNSPVQILSYGTRRKLCLAGALLDQPRLLLLDEPFAGLDYPGIREMRGILRDNRAQGLTQVLSAHDLDPRLKLVWALLAGIGIWCSGPAGLWAWLAVLVCVAAALRPLWPSGLRLWRSGLGFVLFWGLLKTGLDLWAGAALDAALAGGALMALRLFCLLLLGPGLALRCPHVPLSRRWLVFASAVVRNLARRSWEQTVAVAARGLDREEVWRRDFPAPGWDWLWALWTLAVLAALSLW